METIEVHRSIWILSSIIVQQAVNQGCMQPCAGATALNHLHSLPSCSLIAHCHYCKTRSYMIEVRASEPEIDVRASETEMPAKTLMYFSWW
jgi:hypothetical protein